MESVPEYTVLVDAVAIAMALITAGGLLLVDSGRRAGVSEADFQRRHLFTACLTRVLAFWLGLFFLVLGLALLALSILG